MMQKANIILVLCASCLMLGCGFTLRGSATLPPALQTLVLESPDGNPDILREMRRALVASNVTLADTPGAGIYRLVVRETDSTERVLSVNANARAGEYELQVSTTFMLRGAEGIVIGPETVTIERVYLADPNRAVAKQEERDLIEEEMRRELVNLILRRLQNLDV